ncbi:MAG TPA: serine hydrolase domain-containing protein [Acidimicrobiales bacterium]|nr:serine hydrolase domain-containing protein [Acidimicrobiales bacterium]
MTAPAEQLGAVLASEVAGWPGKAAAGVVDGRSEHGRPVLAATTGPIDEPFEWASVTKLLVSVASLVAFEEGTVDLQGAAGPPGSTVGHLLAHASGLPFEGQGPVAPPGKRRIYSNTGIEIAAGHVGSAAGMPFFEYLKGGVLDPLSMSATFVEGSPAYSARSPLNDLLLLAGELLSPTLVSPQTLEMATSVAWPGLAGVLPGFGRQDPCDWGLGPEIRGRKSPHWTGSLNSPRTYGHFGQSGSFLWVDPDARLAVAALGSTTFGPWATEAWPALSDAVLALVSKRN